MSIEQEIQAIDKKILVARLADMPGTAIFLLAVYARFYTDGDAFLAILNDSTTVDGMFIFGVVLMVWSGYKIFQLKRQRNQLLHQSS
ncbi:MAG: hypothetical protein OFPII_20220 [Osedax symbiont Rs1]|nr:MAG: hypothetical protein OFPII_20220 [Osedax symbiont Rs1]